MLTPTQAAAENVAVQRLIAAEAALGTATLPGTIVDQRTHRGCYGKSRAKFYAK